MKKINKIQCGLKIYKIKMSKYKGFRYYCYLKYLLVISIYVIIVVSSIKLLYLSNNYY